MSILAERKSAEIDKLVANLTGDEVVEIGIGLVARGVFRVSNQRGAEAAANVASAVSSTTTAMHLDMVRAVGTPQGTSAPDGRRNRPTSTDNDLQRP